MKLKHRHGFVGALALSAILACAFPASAQTTTGYTNRTSFGGNDLYDWGQLGPPSTFYSNGVTATSTNGDTVTLSDAGNSILRQDNGPVDSMYDHWGNFANGDHLILAENSIGASTAPLKITFAQAVSGVGLQIEEGAISGAYTGKLQAYDASGNLLGMITGSGDNTGAADNSAIFLGLKSTSGADISYIMVSDTGSYGTSSVAVNQMSVIDTPAGPVVPEGSSDLLMLSGLAVPCASYLFRRLRQRK